MNQAFKLSIGFALPFVCVAFILMAHLAHATHCDGTSTTGHTPDGSSVSCPTSNTQSQTNQNNPQSQANQNNPQSQTNPGSSDGQSTGGLRNPLNSDSIEGFLLAIVDILLVFALPIIVFFIIYSGFKMVLARGNPTELETARRAFIWSVVGGLIILGANLIINVIQGTINQL